MNPRPTPELVSALRDIIYWGERLSAHLEGSDKSELQSDPKLCDAACWCISCIGEAAARLRRDWPEFSAENPDLELAKSSAMRNRLVHGYFAIDTATVWTASIVSIPKLVTAARKLLADL